MTPLSAHDLARPDATIRYWTGGTAGAPTIVLLHGATLDHRAWSPQVDALQDRFAIVVPDLRAHGVSTGRFDFDDAVDDILALLAELPARRVVLVGLSLGANIAQAVVHRDPARVRAVVIADAVCNTVPRQPLAASMTVAALTAQAMFSGDGFARHAAHITATDPAARAYVLEANAHRPNREIVAILSSLLISALRPDPDYRLPVPALLVHGDRDSIGDIATSTRAWAQREPLAEYAVIPFAGHASNLDNPAAFTAVLLPFLDRVASLPHPAAATAENEERRGAVPAEHPSRTVAV
jgi:3-oxoadipate enol-lactonase